MKRDAFAITYVDTMPEKNRLIRFVWNIIWLLFFKFSPTPFYAWRNFLLGLFGARIAKGVHVYPSASIWAPWNLEMAEGSCLGPHVICYSMDKITIGSHTTISQYTYLCTGTHDIRHPAFLLITHPIYIGANAWVAADAFVGPGVKIGEGAVVGARAVVVKDVKPWLIVGGNPARLLGKRVIRSAKS